MAKKKGTVGAGDVRKVWDHLTHLKTDIENGDFSHGWVHIWGIMDELREAFAGEPLMRGAKKSLPAPAIEGVSVTETKKGKALSCCDDMEKMLAPHAGMGDHEDDTTPAAAIDWRSFLQLLLKLLPLLI